jgi:hypothetical protein
MTMTIMPAQRSARAPRSSLVKHLPALLGAALAVCALGAPAPARAGEGLAVVLDPKLEGPFSKEEQLKLELGVTEALRGAQLQVVPAPDRQAIEEGEPELKGCRTDECQDRIGRLLSAQSLISQSWKLERGGAAAPAPAAAAGPKGKKKIAPAPPPPEGKGRYSFSVAVFNVTIGAIGAKEEASCASCTVDEAASSLGELVKKAVLLEAGLARGKIEVTSTPSADVLIDGRKLGFTPYKREAYAGKHDITITRTGYRSHHVNIVVEEGKKATVTATLQQGSDKTFRVVRGPRPIWRIGAGAGAIAGGVLMLGFGASALSVNGKCVDGPSADPPCPAQPGGGGMVQRRFDTAALGAGLISVGVALAVAGSVVIALPGEKKVLEVTAGLTGSGPGLLVAGTF